LWDVFVGPQCPFHNEPPTFTVRTAVEGVLSDTTIG
jgi:hypothetical protein